MDKRRVFGNRGEDLAASFFILQGYEVVERNWNCRLGEIDLILEKDGKLHFVEIKTRRSLEFGYPEEAITPTKLKHLARAIEMYLRSKGIEGADFQVHALAILMQPDQPPNFRFIEGIL
ncbi:MAG: YraN family protein [Patescibacteria group bacterium]|nr:YraN family protein [Patescibacteria group bacterium]